MAKQSLVAYKQNRNRILQQSARETYKVSTYMFKAYLPFSKFDKIVFLLEVVLEPGGDVSKLVSIKKVLSSTLFCLIFKSAF